MEREVAVRQVLVHAVRSKATLDADRLLPWFGMDQTNTVDQGVGFHVEFSANDQEMALHLGPHAQMDAEIVRVYLVQIAPDHIEIVARPPPVLSVLVGRPSATFIEAVVKAEIRPPILLLQHRPRDRICQSEAANDLGCLAVYVFGIERTAEHLLRAKAGNRRFAIKSAIVLLQGESLVRSRVNEGRNRLGRSNLRRTDLHCLVDMNILNVPENLRLGSQKDRKTDVVLHKFERNCRDYAIQ